VLDRGWDEKPWLGRALHLDTRLAQTNRHGCSRPATSCPELIRLALPLLAQVSAAAVAPSRIAAPSPMARSWGSAVLGSLPRSRTSKPALLALA
jgi:hypothetical protein